MICVYEREKEDQSRGWVRVGNCRLRLICDGRWIDEVD